MNKNNLSKTAHKNKIVEKKIEDKKWVKRLEEITGRKLDLNKQQLGNIYFLLDCSSSMGSYNKLDQAKEGAISYAVEAKNKGYVIGLIKFDSVANHILEPQQHLESFNIKVKKISASGSTNMTDAIQQAIDKFELKIGEKIIFIVTDGMPDSRESTIKVATLAKEKGIEIMTLGTDDADKAFLNQLSTKKEFSIKVANDKLLDGIISMAKLLPEKK